MINTAQDQKAKAMIEDPEFYVENMPESVWPMYCEVTGCVNHMEYWQKHRNDIKHVCRDHVAESGPKFFIDPELKRYKNK